MKEDTNLLRDETVSRGMFGIYESFKDDDAYNSSNCLNYSIIKNVYHNPEALFRKKDDEDREWLTFGNLTDLITTHRDKPLEDKVVVNNKVPSEQFKRAADYILTNGLITSEMPITALTDKQIKEIYTNSGSQANYKPETKRQKLIDECGEYITIRVANSGKIIVTTEMFNEANNLATVFTTHRWSKNLFMSKADQEKNNIEIYYQYKIKYIFEGMQCKSKLDIIVIDHDTMTISPYDIKTGSDLPESFISYTLFKYKLIYQACLYKEGLTTFCSKLQGFKDYDIEPFRFVYVSRLVPTYPRIVKISDAFHEEIKTYGVSVGSYRLPSLLEIFEAIDWYTAKIDRGETPIEPWYLQATNGEEIANKTQKIYPY